MRRDGGSSAGRTSIRQPGEHTEVQSNILGASCLLDSLVCQAKQGMTLGHISPVGGGQRTPPSPSLTLPRPRRSLANHLLLLSGKLAVGGKQRVRRPAQPHSGPGVGDDGPKRAPLSLTGDLILSPPAVGLPAASPYTELARV